MENYKKTVHQEARAGLRTQFWKPEHIGTGSIHADVVRAIATEVVHNGHKQQNNLIDWRLKDDFKNLTATRLLEQALFDLYKSKRPDQACFTDLESLGLKYQLVAYLFFLKDRNRFLPISQGGFDRAFTTLTVDEFHTVDNISWENYTTFIDIVREAQEWLRTRVQGPVVLLDAHSFLWTVGSTIPKYVAEQEAMEVRNRTRPTLPLDATMPGNQTVTPPQSETASLQPEFTADGFPEGKEKWVLHRKAERDPEVVRIAKERYRERDPLLRCEVCTFSFAERYGPKGIGYIEAHHVLPMSEMPPGHRTKPDDLVMVCANCHVMLHLRRPWLKHDELIALLQ